MPQFFSREVFNIHIDYKPREIKFSSSSFVELYFDLIYILKGWTCFSLRKLIVDCLSFKLPPSNNIIDATGHYENILFFFINFELHYAIFGKPLQNSMSILSTCTLIKNLTWSFSATCLRVSLVPSSFTSINVTTSLWSQSSISSGFGSPSFVAVNHFTICNLASLTLNLFSVHFLLLVR